MYSVFLDPNLLITLMTESSLFNIEKAIGNPGWQNHKQIDFFSILLDISDQQQGKTGGFSKSN